LIEKRRRADDGGPPPEQLVEPPSIEADGRVEQSESLDVGVGVEPLAAGGTGGGNGAIPTLPNPQDVL